MLKLEIAENKETPMYGRIAEALSGAVASGRISAGDRLPTEAALARELGVNRLTVRRAYECLHSRGIVTRQRRRGTHVAMDVAQRGQLGAGVRISHLAIVTGVKSLLEHRREYLFIWDEVFSGLREVLGEGGRTLTFLDAFTREEIGDLTRYDAVILLHPKECEATLITEAHQRGIPIVSMWEPKISATIPHVDYDRARSPMLACRYLVECGYRRIGFLGRSIFGSKAPPMKYAVFANVLCEAGLDVCARHVRDVGWAPGKAYAAMRSIIEAGDLPDAFFVDSDYKAMEAICALNDAGIKVPDDIGIVSHDDNPESATFHPPLTTVRAPRREIGRRVAHMLLNWPEKGQKPADVLLQSELIVRASTRNRTLDAEMDGPAKG